MGSPGQMTPRDAAAASDALVRLYASVTVGKAVGFRVTRQGNRFGTFKDEREAALESDRVARILDPEGEKLRLNFPKESERMHAFPTKGVTITPKHRPEIYISNSKFPGLLPLCPPKVESLLKREGAA